MVRLFNWNVVPRTTALAEQPREKTRERVAISSITVRETGKE
jgi:hypothetical protein